jgi:predicted nucleotidyltransferase component of viral defense system
MKPRASRNSAESIRARLLDLAKKRREDFQLTLAHYAIEGLLYRLGQSRYRDQFVLKGAMLFVLWEGQLHRPTRDVDLLGYGSPNPEGIAAIFREICAMEADDGIVLDTAGLRAERIKEDAEYEGVRLSFLAHLAGARIPMQVDVGFGDIVSPVPVSFPAILPLAPPQIQAYQKESVIAEKLQAMVVLDIRNSRMKDFFDLWVLCRAWSFESEPLRKAIVSTFERRSTPLPTNTPFALTDGFLLDEQKAAQWTGFLRRLRLQDETPDLKTVGDELRAFLEPVLGAEAPQALIWPAGGPWRPRR